LESFKDLALVLRPQKTLGLLTSNLIHRIDEERGGPVFLDTNLWKISGSLLSV
jgi:hypothetical protein